MKKLNVIWLCVCVLVKNSFSGPVSDVHHEWLHFRQLNYTLCQWEMSKIQGVFRVWDYVFALENDCFSQCSNFWKLNCTRPFSGKSLPNLVTGDQMEMLPEQKWIQNSRSLHSAHCLPSANRNMKDFPHISEIQPLDYPLTLTRNF